jgi:hypothetical protein
MMCNLPSNNLPCQGLQSGSPAPSILTSEDCREYFASLRRTVDAYCDELEQKLHEICEILEDIKESK